MDEKKPGAQHPQWAPHVWPYPRFSPLLLPFPAAGSQPYQRAGAPSLGGRAGQHPTPGKTMVASTGGWRETKCCSSERLRPDASRRKAACYLVVQGILQQALAYLT